MIRVVDAGGKAQCRRLRTAQANEVERLRLVRRGKTFWFLYRKKGSDHDEIVAQQEVLEAIKLSIK